MSEWGVVAGAFAVVGILVQLAPSPSLADVAVEKTAVEAPPLDTTFTVAPGARLSLTRARDDVMIEAWDRNEVRIVDDDDPEDRGLLVEQQGEEVTVRWTRGASDVVLFVPRWLPVSVDGRDLELSVVGLRSDLSVTHVSGDIVLRDVHGGVQVVSASGEIEVFDGVGDWNLRTGDDVDVAGMEGNLVIDTSYGDVTLRSTHLSRLAVTTTDGDITLGGELRPDGEYAMTSHSGDLAVILAGTTGGEFDAVTFQGELSTDIPMRLESFVSGAASRFTVGDGDARVVLQTFSGDIEVRGGGGGRSLDENLNKEH